MYALDDAAVPPQDLQGEAASRKVIEYAGMVTRYAHAAAEGGEIDIHLRRLAAAAQQDRVGLHVVFEALSLELCETHNGVVLVGVAASSAAGRAAASALGHGSEREEEKERWAGLSHY